LTGSWEQEPTDCWERSETGELEGAGCVEAWRRKAKEKEARRGLKTPLRATVTSRKKRAKKGKERKGKERKGKERKGNKKKETQSFGYISISTPAGGALGRLPRETGTDKRHCTGDGSANKKLNILSVFYKSNRQLKGKNKKYTRTDSKNITKKIHKKK